MFTPLTFTKINTLGNDYLYVWEPPEELTRHPALIRRLSDRHHGVGSDGLIGIYPSTRADFKMRIWNSDGSEGRTCGNGLRGTAKFVFDGRFTTKQALVLETLGGLFPVNLTINGRQAVGATVNMGPPRFKRRDVPVMGNPDDEAWGLTVSVAGNRLKLYALSFGNPHCVVPIKSVANFPVTDVGPRLEHHPLFPDRVNVEFVEVVSPTLIKQRTWERGAGETLACGSGACAAVVATHRLGLTREHVTVSLLGGKLKIHWRDHAGVLTTGPATEVFRGKVRL